MRGMNQAFDSYDDELILSANPNSSELATIEGSFGETIIVSWDCWISSPGPAKRIVVDPGNITFTVMTPHGFDRVRACEIPRHHSVPIRLIYDIRTIRHGCLSVVQLVPAWYHKAPNFCIY